MAADDVSLGEKIFLESSTTLLPPPSSQDNNDEDLCSICLNCVTDHHERKTIQDMCACEPTFHDRCIREWISLKHDTCPNCRRKLRLSSDDYDDEADEYISISNKLTYPIFFSLTGIFTLVGYYLKSGTLDEAPNALHPSDQIIVAFFVFFFMVYAAEVLYSRTDLLNLGEIVRNPLFLEALDRIPR
jgi:hypothetical protein